jgi:L-rhamnose mutarotase
MYVFLYLFTLFLLAGNGCSPKPSERAADHEMQRYGSVIGLKPEYEERYIILHRHAFPGVLERIRQCNIRNYSIFLKDSILFSHFEYVGSDFDADMAAMADDVTKDWWKLTDPMQKPLEGRKEGEWWASAELVFEMDSSIVPYQDVQRGVFEGVLKPGQKENFAQRLRQMNKTIIASYLNHHFQNLTFYVFGTSVYFYYEYSGKDFRTDTANLFSIEEVSQLDQDLKAMLQQDFSTGNERTWIPMKEVFHTD